MELEGKTAIVTGAGRSIGEGIALVLAHAGAQIVVNDMDPDNADKTAQEIVSEGGKAIPFQANVTQKAELDEMVAETIKQFGAVDILVNNAGIEAPPNLLVDLTEEQWDRVLGVNLKGVFLCCKAVVPTMIEQNKGKIINIGSTASIRMTFFGSVDYTVSKHGVAGLTQHLAWELADHHITVNTVCPGGVLTPLMEEGSSPEFRDRLVQRLVPLGRFCSIEEIGEVVSFLASDRADMITGQMLAVDGGLLTGFGEDLRAVVRKRMADMKAARAKKEPAPKKVAAVT
jgi:NAD(P)-dependent dehydrogenase (short-subunit alcohol dehydrogenase family)